MASAVVGTLRALLTADTAEFTRAMKSATADVQVLGEKLQKDLEPRQRAVNAAVRDFLGGNEIRKAQEYVQAVQAIEGADKLVEADQLRVNKAMQDAIGHYQKLGVDAPQAMRDLEAATRKVEAPAAQTGLTLEKMWSGLKSAAGLIGVAFTAGAVVNFAGKIFDAASHIKDMSDRLGISAEAAQRFKFAAEQTGATMEDVEKSIGIMNRTLETGDKSTVGALKKAGVEFSTIRAMQPEEAFRTIADAVGAIEDPMTRANVAQELFGKGATRLLPGMIEGYTKLGEAATVMSNETVIRLEAAKDAWEALWSKVTIWSGEIVGAMMSVGDYSSKLSDAIAANAKRHGTSLEEEKQAVYRLSRAEQDAYLAKVEEQQYLASESAKMMALFAKSADTRIQKTQEEQKADEERAKAAKKANDERLQALATLQFGLGSLTAAEYDQIAALLDAGKAEHDIAKAYGFSAEAVKVVAREEKFRADALAQHQKMTADAVALGDKLLKAVNQDKLKRDADYLKQFIVNHAAIEKTEKDTARSATLAALGEYDKKRELLYQHFADAVAVFKGGEAQTAEHYQVQLAALKSHLGDIDAAQVTAASDTKAKVEAVHSELQTAVAFTLSNLGKSVEGSFASMILGAKGFKDGFVDIWGQIKASAEQVMAEILASFTHRFIGGMLNALTGAQGGFSGAFAGMFSGIGGGTAASAAAGVGAASGVGAGAAAGAGGAASGLVAAIAAPAIEALVGWNIATGLLNLIGGGEPHEDSTLLTPEQWAATYGGPAGTGPNNPYPEGYDPGNLPALAGGGVVLPTADGTIVKLAEAGYPEAVIPMTGGAGSMTIVLQQDGRRAAEWLVPFIPGAVKQFRLA